MPRLPLFGGVGAYFCCMIELEELIREYEEGIALEMYHEMVDYIDNHGADIMGRNVDYTLKKVISTVRASAYMPEGTMLALRGYEIVVETQMGLGISFCMGQFWIGGKLILIRYEEEIENYLVHFINNILPGGLSVWKEKMEHVEMDLLKREKIRNILENSAESLIQTVLEEKGLEYRLCFRDSGIELLVYRNAKYLTYSDFRYETFSDDFRDFVDGKLKTI